MTEDLHTMLKNQEDHELRILAFEALCKTYNEQLVAFQVIAGASKGSDYLTGIRETGEGFELTFAFHGTFSLRHGLKGAPGSPGQDGENGTDGNQGSNGNNGANGTDGIAAPIVGIREDKGVLYWTTTLEDVTSWLRTPEGAKIRVNGEQGGPGEEGSNGSDGQNPIPVLGVDAQGYWTINGSRVKDVNGKEVKAQGPDGAAGANGTDAPPIVDGSSIFKNVTYYPPDSVLFEQKDAGGKRFVLPVFHPLEFGWIDDNITPFTPGSSQTVTYRGTGITEIRFLLPHRWRAVAAADHKTITITAPAGGELNAAGEGVLTILVFNGKGSCRTAEITLKMNTDSL